MVASRDRFGALWFGGVSSGLSRLVPEPDQSHSPPPILISGLRVAGVPARHEFGSRLGQPERRRRDEPEYGGGLGLDQRPGPRMRAAAPA